MLPISHSRAAKFIIFIRHYMNSNHKAIDFPDLQQKQEEILIDKVTVHKSIILKCSIYNQQVAPYRERLASTNKVYHIIGPVAPLILRFDCINQGA